MKNITTSNWAAWLNKQPIQPTPGGTLHVIGDVDTHSESFSFLHKKIPQGINPSVLLLDLKVENGTAPVKNPQKVHYAELLEKGKLYTSIEIFLEERKIDTITKIPIVV